MSGKGYKPNGLEYVQVTLGVSALLAYVPPSLGAAHQATALLLFTIMLGLLHNLRPVLPASHLLLRAAAPGLAGVSIVGSLTIMHSQIDLTQSSPQTQL